MAQLTTELDWAQQFDEPVARLLVEEHLVAARHGHARISLPVALEGASASLAAAATWSVWDSRRFGSDLLPRVISVSSTRTVPSKLFDHRVRILVEDGRIRHKELRKCGVTENDLFTELRQRGILSLKHLRHVLYEPKGSI